MPINPSPARSIPLPSVTPRHLAAFVAVAEAGAFAAGAARLGLAQSTVSTLLRDMEDRLETRLLARTTRRANLTEAGERFLPHARRLLVEMEAALRKVGPPAGRPLRIAVTPLVASILLPPALAGLEATPGALRPVLLEASPSEVPDLVRRGDATLGLGSFIASEIADLGRRRLARDNIMLFCPAGHPLAGHSGRALSWRDLAGVPEIAVTRGSEVGRLVLAARIAAGVPEQAPAYEVTRLPTALALVAAGLGVAALPGSAAPLAARGARVTRHALRPVVRREVLAIWRGASLPSALAPVMRALMEVGYQQDV
ncbi:MAG TPA: LysR substrate-binding domain-containing protein [Roseomonas sp.]|jgi:DNA-binding transcriptional LysR family regulator